MGDPLKARAQSGPSSAMNATMDPAMIKMLAEQMDLTEDEVTALENGDLAPVISKRFADDPAANALLLEMLREQNREQPQSVSNSGDRKMAARRVRQQMQRARRTVRALREELQAAHTVINYFAELFGACPACFGQDENCEQCGGEGAAGTSRPHRKRLLEWTKPALDRLGLAITRTDNRSTENRSTDHNTYSKVPGDNHVRTR